MEPESGVVESQLQIGGVFMEPESGVVESQLQIGGVFKEMDTAFLRVMALTALRHRSCE